MKPCCNCGELFEPKRDKSYRCPPCKSAYNRAHYLQNRDDYIFRATKRKILTVTETSKRVLEYLSTHPCVDCGESDPVVLEFDHVREKITDVARLVYDGFSWAAISDEIAKCEVRCANCHRRVTAKRGNWLKFRMSETPC